jgi:hypothetical protein
MPSMAFSISTTRSRRRLNTALLAAMKSCGPFSASTAAHWLIEQGLEVDCDWILRMAADQRLRPAA